MSGPDLRFLAERASVLEDRTAERLTEVHGRIAVARERRRTGTALGAAGLVVAVFVGLAVVQHDRGVNTPAPAPNPTQTGTVDVGAEAVPPPETGTCWAVPPRVVSDGRPTFDDSRQVPCTQPHTTETVGWLRLGEPTVDEVTPTSATCWQMARAYLGVDPGSWIPWWSVEYLPSKQQVAAGASWVRCDVAVPDRWGPTVPPLARSMRTSIRGAADRPHPERWVCLAQPPTENQAFVSCDRPHAYEATGTLAIAPTSTTYPSSAELAAEAQDQCSPEVPRRLAGVSVTAVWDPKELLDQGLPVAGVCFMYHPSGELLPPR